MKQRFLLLTFLLISLVNQIVMADPPGPPGPGGDPGGSGGVPVGSPIDSQTIILLVLAFAYGVYKIVEFRKHKSAGVSER